jgi:GNAT superfamily N-acetyltransferase
LSGLTIEDVVFDSPLAQSLIDEVQQEYVVRYGSSDQSAIDSEQFGPPYGAFLVATIDGVAIGCAGLRRHGEDVVEIKRMFVRSAHRRHGHARNLLLALEDRARDNGFRRVVLETGLAQPEAIAFYTSEGYLPIAGFGHYKDEPLSRSFGKDLEGRA